MKCILDTDVMVAALRSASGASREIVRLIGRKEIIAVASVATMLEYEAVLKRPEHLQAANLSAAQVDTLLDALATLFVPVTSHFVWRPLMQDPDDEMILEAAVNGQVEAIVTFNTRHFRSAAARFGIEVLLPAEYLRSVRHDNE
jgi:putative PIN family toxin of toxin-antitoxin system